MNPHQVPIQSSGTYNQSPQQQANMIPSMYQQPIYQNYPQQYIPQAQNMSGYQNVFRNPQTNPPYIDMSNNRPNMGNVPQQNQISGIQQNQMMNMHDNQMDLRPNIRSQYQQNSLQWHSAPGPFPNDPHYYQYSSNQRPMYMPAQPVPTHTPTPPPLQQSNQIRSHFYPQYTSGSNRQQIPQYQSNSNKNPKASKKSNSHQTNKNTNQNKTNNANQNNNNQPKSKANKNSKKQKKQSGHDAKKQNSRDTSSIERTPPSITIEQQCQKWGWVLPPLPQRSLNQKTSNTITTQTTDLNNTSENNSKSGFTLKSLIKMSTQEEEMNNDNDDDSFLYNDNSDSNNSDADNNNNNNIEDENFDDDGVFGNEDENFLDSDEENDSNDEINSDVDNNNFNQHEENPSNDVAEEPLIKIDDRYRDEPIKRVLFLWDQMYKS